MKNVFKDCVLDKRKREGNRNHEGRNKSPETGIWEHPRSEAGTRHGDCCL